jgi:hypothetical protein
MSHQNVGIPTRLWVYCYRKNEIIKIKILMVIKTHKMTRLVKIGAQKILENFC